MKRPKRKKRGKVNLSKIRTTSAYSFNDIAQLFGCNIATVRRWKRDGLPIMNNTKPILVHGTELKAWLQSRQKARKRPCAPDEMFCFSSGCRKGRLPAIGSVRIRKSNQKVGMIEAQCNECRKNIRKGYAMADLAEIEKIFESYKGNIEDICWPNNPPLNVTLKG